MQISSNETIPFLFFPQTQEVQKAMDQKRFEEAVKLRGRYDRQTELHSVSVHTGKVDQGAILEHHQSVVYTQCSAG